MVAEGTREDALRPGPTVSRFCFEPCDPKENIPGRGLPTHAPVPHMSAAETPAAPKPNRLSGLLALVRQLIDYGRHLATTLRGNPHPLGAGDIALILARITRGLLRAEALEARLIRNAPVRTLRPRRHAFPRTAVRRSPHPPPPGRRCRCNPRQRPAPARPDPGAQPLRRHARGRSRPAPLLRFVAADDYNSSRRHLSPDVAGCGRHSDAPVSRRQ